MLSSFRRLSKSKVGTIILVAFLVALLASFAITDLANVRQGGLGLSSGTLASVGGTPITDRELTGAMDRRLSTARRENPEATMADVIGDFDDILNGMLQRAALTAWADEIGLRLSRRLVDAEIARIPGLNGLDGRFSPANYQQFLSQQRLTDSELRQGLAGDLLTQMLLSPVGGNSQIAVGIARPYASMLLEQRTGEVAILPFAAFAGGAAPTEAEIARFYQANRNRYMVPEQRVLRIARIGPDQVAGATATDAEIAAFYNANQATYGGKSIRVISQTVSPDRATADAIARRARAGGTFVAAAAPAGFSAADISVGPQTRQQFEQLAGAQVAAAAFGAAEGAIVGPVQSDLGWHVVRVDDIRDEAGRSLVDARAEIAARLTAEKRRNALTDLVTRVEDMIADGSSFAEAVAAGRLEVIETPLITATGAARGQPGYRLPADLAPVLAAGFDMAPDDDPYVETLPGEAGYALVAVGSQVPSAPQPLAEIRDRVATDFVARRTQDRARAAGNAIAAKAGRGMPLAQAVREANVPGLPAPRSISARRIDISRMGPQIPPPLQILFAIGAGKARLVEAGSGDGLAVIRVGSIQPGNATAQPALITQTQREFGQLAGQEYAEQFLRAVQTELGVRRNEEAIRAARQRLSGTAG